MTLFDETFEDNLLPSDDTPSSDGEVVYDPDFDSALMAPNMAQPRHRASRPKKAIPVPKPQAPTLVPKSPSLLESQKQAPQRLLRGFRDELFPSRGPIGQKQTPGDIITSRRLQPLPPNVARPATTSERSESEQAEALSALHPWTRSIAEGIIQSGGALQDLGAGALSLIDDALNEIWASQYPTQRRPKGARPGFDIPTPFRTWANRISKSTEEDARIQAGADWYRQTPAQQLTQFGVAQIGPLAAVMGGAEVTGSLAATFGLQKMFEARSRGITDPKELAKQGLLGAVEGKIFHRLNQAEMGAGRIAGQATLGAAQGVVDPLSLGQPVTAEGVVKSAGSNLAMDLALGNRSETAPHFEVSDPSQIRTIELNRPTPKLPELDPETMLPFQESQSPLRPTDERTTNRRAFVAKADPRLRNPEGDPIFLYHGTQSPREITQVNFSKSDPNALYGPGFYMTQDSEIAAGELGYTKKRGQGNVTDEEVRQFFTPGNIVPGYGGYDRVLEFRPDKDYGFNVKVIAVNPSTGEPMRGEMPRWHSTLPSSDRIAQVLGGLSPHAYKLHANIEHPFDIDAPADPQLSKEVSQLPGMPKLGGHLDQLDLADTYLKPKTNKDLYASLMFNFDGNKAEVNKWLQSQGFDGITHIGGGNIPTSPKFSDVEKAIKYAKETGGQIAGITEYNEDGSNKWIVKGHRVWIAFHPEQVKSATGNIGEFNPSRPGLSESQPTQPNPRMQLVDPYAYELQASVDKAKAPVLLAPSSFFRAVGQSYQRKPSLGLRIPLAQLGQVLEALKPSMSPSQFSETEKAIDQARVEAQSRGLTSIAVVDRTLSDQKVQEVIQHETFHVGQGQAASLRALSDLHLLHDPNYLENHPIFQKALEHPFGQEVSTFNGKVDPGVLAYELPTYIASQMELRPGLEGVNDFGLSSSESIDFLTDYLEHIDERHGPEALSILEQTATLRDNISELFKFVRSNLETKRATQQSSTNAEPEFEIIPLDSLGLGSSRPTEGTPFAASERPLQNSEEMARTSPDRTDFRADEVGDQEGDGGRTPPTEPDETSLANEPPGLREEVIANIHNKTLTDAFVVLLRSGNIKYQRGMAPSLQVHSALIQGKLRPEAIEPILQAHGMSWDDFADEALDTASYFGRGLGYYSQIEKAWDAFRKENPSLAERLIGPRRRAQAAMRALEQTMLNRNLWQRLGGTMQKMVLTQLSTAAVNNITTLGRIPIEIASQGLGAFLEGVDNAKAKPLSERLAKGSKDAIEAMDATMQVARALNPKQLAQVMRGQLDQTEYQRNLDTVVQLEKAFPDLHRKLVQMSMGPDTLKGGQENLELAKSLLPQISDKKTRQTMQRKLDLYDRRMKSNTQGVGRLLSAIETPYDFMLKPMQFSEFLFRRPMFVGQLRLELAREGHDLSTVLEEGRLAEIPKDAVERAVNKALEFTYAYMPSRQGPGFERAGAAFIDTMNALGPLSFVAGEPFSKAMYNGMKFMYEFSPLGMLVPGTKRLMQRMLVDPKTGEKYSENPMTHSDYERLGRGLVGTAMFAAFYMAGKTLFGDEWWQLKTGMKKKDGRPVYIDIRRFQPISNIVHLADLAHRLLEGRAQDIKMGNEFADILTNIKVDSPKVTDTINTLFDMWGDEDTGARGQTALRGLGQYPAIPLTPLLNLRDLIAQFSDDENRKKDLSESGVLGPSIDRLPWYRRRLPDLTAPGEPSPIRLSEAPALNQPGALGFLGGIKAMAARGPAAEEWARLGLSPNRFLKRDPDPIINRATNDSFNELLQVFGDDLVSRPDYQSMTEAEKMAEWEKMIEGDHGLAQAARKEGERANPEEMIRRELRHKMGPLERKATGQDEFIEQIK